MHGVDGSVGVKGFWGREEGGREGRRVGREGRRREGRRLVIRMTGGGGGTSGLSRSKAAEHGLNT